MSGLFTSAKDLEEKIFKKAVAADKPTFLQGLLGTGDYNRYLRYVKNQHKKQFDIEKEEVKRRFDLQEKQLKLQIDNKRKDLDNREGIAGLKNQLSRARTPEEKTSLQNQLTESKKRVDYELRFLNEELRQFVEKRQREDNEMRFRHKAALEQAVKDARQRLDEARQR